MIIETKPFEDEYGNRSWKNDKCRLGRACIQGYKENPIPDICDCYREPTLDVKYEQCTLKENKMGSIDVAVVCVKKEAQEARPRARMVPNLVGLP